MQRKERCHAQAPPAISRGPIQQKEQQHGVDGVEARTDRMVPRRVQPEQLTVKHVREPSKRMPVCRLGAPKSPKDVRPSKACADVIVLRYVRRVIKVQE